MRKLLFVLVTLPFFICALSQNPPRILLTNDDGIDAPGLVAMHKALSRVGRVTVAAPATNSEWYRPWFDHGAQSHLCDDLDG